MLASNKSIVELDVGWNHIFEAGTVDFFEGMTDNEGVTCKEAGERHGMTKNAVIGLRNRIRKTIYCYDGCQKNDNMDYSLKPLWWQDVV